MFLHNCAFVLQQDSKEEEEGGGGRQRLSSAVPAANYCSAQSEHIPLCWLPLLLFQHRAALSKLLHTVHEPVAVRSFLSQSNYFYVYSQT